MKKILSILLSLLTIFSMCNLMVTPVSAITKENIEKEYFSTPDTSMVKVLMSLNWDNYPTDATNATTSTNQYISNDNVQYELDVNGQTATIKSVSTPVGLTELTVPRYIVTMQIEKSDGGETFGEMTLNQLVSELRETTLLTESDYENLIKNNQNLRLRWNFGDTEATVRYSLVEVTDITGGFDSTNCTIKNLVLPESIRTLKSSAFSENPYIETIYAPKIREIASKGLYNCINLKYIYAPDLRYIRDNAFYKCNLLNDIDISSIIRIEKNAFFDCVSLKKISFSTSVNYLGESAFEGCTALEEIVFPEDISISVIPKRCFAICSSLKTIKFSSNIISIAESAFTDCSTLKVLDMRETNLDTIGKNAFWGCLRLEYVILPQTLVTFSVDAFDNCTKLRYVYFTNILTEDQLELLSKSELSKCSITEADIEAPKLYNATRNEEIAEKEIVIYEETNFNVYDVVDVNSIDCSSPKDAIVFTKQLSQKYNQYKTYIYTFKISDKGTYKIIVEDFFGNKTTYTITYSNDPKPSPTSYTTIYHGNGGITSANKDTISVENEIKEINYFIKNTFKKTGYTFMGWDTSVEGKTAVYKNEQEIPDNLINNSDKPVINVYAVWNANDCILKYDANGGIGTMSSQYFVFNKGIKLNKNAFSKAGYTFGGWTYINNYGVETTCNDSSTINDINVSDNNVATIYAKWVPITYTISYNANNGNGEMQSKTYGYDDDITLQKCVFLREGYTFIGWSLSTTGTAKYTDEEVVNHLTTTDEKTVVLYAVWQANTYKLKFNSNGGTGTMANQEITYDKEVSISANKFTKTGYAFMGWSLTKDGEVAFANNKIKNLTSENNDTIELFAVWSPITYTISYNANNGNGEMQNNICEYDDNIVLSKCNFSREGYEFIGWSLSSTGAVKYTNEEVVNHLTTINEKTVVLYAVWQANTYKLKFNSNGGAGTMVEQEISYDKEVSISTCKFTKTGYTFMGWSLSKDGEIAFSNNRVKNLTSKNNAVVELFAVWTPITYTISYNANNGNGEMQDNVCEYDDSIVLPKCSFSREGYKFIGWSLSSTGAVKYTDEEIVNHLTTTNEKTVVLYAVWQANTYKLKFNANGGTGIMFNQEIVYDKETSISSCNFTKPGYTFMGWSLSKNGEIAFSNNRVKNLTPKNNAVVELFAVWIPNTYTIKFDGNNADNGVINNTLTAIYDKNISLIKNPYIKEGYLFTGWSIKKGSTKDFSETEIVKNLNSNANGTTTLYAVWFKLIAGDVDLDNSVTVTDARLVLRKAIGLENLHEGVIADVNDDGAITVSDARIVLRAAIGLEKIGNK